MKMYTENKMGHYKSCHLLEHGIYFYYDSIQVCCFLTGKVGTPFWLKKNYNGEKIDWDTLCDQLREIREKNKQGIYDPHCEGCFNLVDGNWDEDEYFSNFYISNWTKCNCNCSYCYTEEFKKYFNTRQEYKMMPILQEMIERKLLRFNGYLAYGGGEPACLDEFDDITHLFLDNNVRSIVTNTSGIKPVKSILEGIPTGRLDVTVSIDSSNRETYKKIKQIDAYDKVIETLKTYAAAQTENKTLVRSKYIIIPDVNDDLFEIEHWLEQSVEIGLKQVCIDIEGRWYIPRKNCVPQNIADLISFIEHRTKDLGLGLFYYSYADQFRHDRDAKLKQ